MQRRNSLLPLDGIRVDEGHIPPFPQSKEGSGPYFRGVFKGDTPCNLLAASGYIQATFPQPPIAPSQQKGVTPILWEFMKETLHAIHWPLPG